MFKKIVKFIFYYTDDSKNKMVWVFKFGTTFFWFKIIFKKKKSNKIKNKN